MIFIWDGKWSRLGMASTRIGPSVGWTIAAAISVGVGVAVAVGAGVASTGVGVADGVDDLPAGMIVFVGVGNGVGVGGSVAVAIAAGAVCAGGIGSISD